MDKNSTEVIEYTSYIDKLPGVLNSNIVLNGDEIAEIHILSDISRSPKQLVRDIQSLLMAQFNKEIDHKVISIAQIDVCVPQRSSTRLVIEEVAFTKRRASSEFRVSLSYKGQVHCGASSCTNDSADIYRAIAQATLAAAAQAQGGDTQFSVLDVRFCELAGERAVVVCISIKTPGGILGRYSGSSFASDDMETAIVRATLCAINRKIFNA